MKAQEYASKKSKNYNIEHKNQEFKRRLYEWVLDLLRFVKTLPLETANSVLTKQLIRSGTSILANYIEASAASSRKDYINFYSYALKSANESKVWIALIRDTNLQQFVNKATNLLKEVTEFSNILASSIITMRKK